MSQEKVDRYKAEKANRKEIMKKQKTMSLMRKTALGVIAVALIGWLGYSAYGTYQNSQPRDVVEIDYDAITQYVNEL